MKVKILAALLMTGAITNSYAIPPYPLSAIVKERTADTLICKDLNALTEEEIDALNLDPDRIESVDLELREICYK